MSVFYYFKDAHDYVKYKFLFIISIIVYFVFLYKPFLNFVFRKNISNGNYKTFLNYYIFFIIVIFIIKPYIVVYINKIAINNKLKDNNRLYDIIHNIIDKPKNNILNKLNDIIPKIAIASYILIAIYFKNIKAVLSLMLAFSLIFLLRSILIFVTLLPDSSGNCKINLITGSCHDLICSGHYASTLMIYLLFKMYNFIPKMFLNILLVLVIFYSIIPITTQNHYTIDILVAILADLTIYKYFINPCN